MSIFYVIFIVLAAYFSFKYDRIEEYDSHKQHRLWLMCFYLVCLSGFSYGLGADKFTYLEEFDEYPDHFSDLDDIVYVCFMTRGQMPLWTILNMVCKVVFDSFYAVQFFEAVIINVAVCYVASKYTHRYFLFLIIYFLSLQFFVFNTEVMREGFAIGLSLFGIHGWLTGKKWLFFGILPLALGFHVSAAILLVFPFARVYHSWLTLIIASVFTFGFWLLSDTLMKTVINIAFGGQGAMTEKVMFYSIQASTFFGYLRSYLTYLFFPYIVLYMSIQSATDANEKSRLEKIASFMLLLAIIASSIVGLRRFYNYVQIFQMALFVEFLYTMLCHERHLIVRFGTSVGTLAIMLWFYFAHYESTNTYHYQFFYPYTCILDEDADVYYRKIAHQEAVTPEVKDNNVRNIK